MIGKLFKKENSCKRLEEETKDSVIYKLTFTKERSCFHTVFISLGIINIRKSIVKNSETLLGTSSESIFVGINFLNPKGRTPVISLPRMDIISTNKNGIDWRTYWISLSNISSFGRS